MSFINVIRACPFLHFVWITQSILLFSYIFCQLFQGDFDGVISQNGKILEY